MRKTVIVGSTNPVKVRVAEKGFISHFPDEQFNFEGISCDSEVSDQPWSEEVTALGAFNRARHARKLRPEADYWVGQEGGLIIRPSDSTIWLQATIMVLDRAGNWGEGKSASFRLPDPILTLIDTEKLEMKAAADKFFGLVNSGQKEGTVAAVTNGLITREALYLPALLIAIGQLRTPEWYRKM